VTLSSLPSTSDDGVRRMRVCIVYDCLYPWTIGGAERFYASLAAALAADGHDVTYVTARQWSRSAPPALPGVHVVSVAPRLQLYRGGRRKILPPLVFGAGVLAHLLRHGRRYDAVHTAAFPFFSVLAAAAARRLHRFKLVVDWPEVWTCEYWRRYAGRLAGAVGCWVQGRCARVRHEAVTFSRLHSTRLAGAGGPASVELVRGLYGGRFAGDVTVRPPAPPRRPPAAVYAGRHTAEKRLQALVPAIEWARRLIPDLVLDVYGDGPERQQLVGAVARARLDGIVRVHGNVEASVLETALDDAACLVLPSEREGYGLVLVEAMAVGCPVVVVAGPDNAATEFVEAGVNGAIAASVDADVLGRAIAEVVGAGNALRESTAAWFAVHAPALSMASTLDVMLRIYARP
jgi:glycosyltransferase involved in cell wall biosynthesis